MFKVFLITFRKALRIAQYNFIENNFCYFCKKVSGCNRGNEPECSQSLIKRILVFIPTFIIEFKANFEGYLDKYKKGDELVFYYDKLRR